MGIERWCVFIYVCYLQSEELSFFNNIKYLGLIWKLWHNCCGYLGDCTCTSLLLECELSPSFTPGLNADSCHYSINDGVSVHSFQKAGESRQRGFSGSETLHERPTTINITNKKENPKSFRTSSIQRELICLLYTTLSTVLFRLALVMIKSFGFGNIFFQKICNE